jgi:hypothetical protein
MRRRYLLLAAVAIAIGAAVLAYGRLRWPGYAIVRGHVGDGAATLLVFALLSLRWRARPAVRAFATIAIATAVELGQLVWHSTSLAGELLVGGTFDWWDVVAYIVGAGVAWLVAPWCDVSPPEISAAASSSVTASAVVTR